jgi:hypothetical protein
LAGSRIRRRQAAEVEQFHIGGAHHAGSSVTRPVSGIGVRSSMEKRYAASRSLSMLSMRLAMVKSNVAILPMNPAGCGCFALTNGIRRMLNADKIILDAAAAYRQVPQHDLSQKIGKAN